MKTLIVACSLLAAGCVTHRETVVAPIHLTVDIARTQCETGENPILTALAKAAVGPDTAVGQMTLGCAKFYEQNGRWPQSKDEIAIGLGAANLPSTTLNRLSEISLHEESGVLVVDFLSTENGRVTGKIRFQPPNT